MDIFQVMKQFPTQKSCIRYLQKVRWGTKPVCPYCGVFKPKPTPIPKEQRYHCNSCNKSFSVTVDTIFHNTNLPLQKWFLAISLIINAKKGISARQLGRNLHVNKNTAWRIAMQIREAMQGDEQQELLQGIIEMDETYIGGKVRKQGKGSNEDHRIGGFRKRRSTVVGIIERNGDVRAEHAKDPAVKFKSLSSLVRQNVDLKKSVLITDESKVYKRMKDVLPHRSIDHSIWFSQDGWIHTNSIESFWALLKRGIVGQFHKVSAKHLYKYINEFAYRFNHRNNGDTFSLTIKRAVSG